MILPRVSLVMATYNRAYCLPRAIESVQTQTYENWELVIIDDGSTDDTKATIERICRGDPRIRVFTHDRNRGVTAAKNTGFNHATGDWVGTLDSDDELVPSALSTLLIQLERVDGRLDAISCNCIDSSTGTYAGQGLDRDQRITLRHSVRVASGEHWGIFRRELLGAHRFNENIRGYESVLWSRIFRNANWYYVHQGLRIYHTHGHDRLSSQPRGRQAWISRVRHMNAQYAAIIDQEHHYLAHLQECCPTAAIRFCRKAASTFLLIGDRKRFDVVAHVLHQSGDVWGARTLRAGMRVAHRWLRERRSTFVDR